MDHRRAVDLLPRLRAGDLTSGEYGGLLRHLTECADCAAWAETYSLLADAASSSPWRRHPGSDLLARLAVDVESLPPAEQAALDEHLTGCEACREALRLAAGALREARGVEAGGVTRLRSVVGSVPPRLALAATLILAVGLAFLLRPVDSGPESALRPATGATQTLPRTATTPAAESLQSTAVMPDTSAPSIAPPGRPDVIALSDGSLVGNRLIDTRGSISADALSIERGSDVTFRAGEAVVLGDGFTVSLDAEFTVELAAAAAAAPIPFATLEPTGQAVGVPTGPPGPSISRPMNAQLERRTTT